MVNRRRVATNVKVLPPKVVPISPADHQQAVAALIEVIEQWWRDRQDVEPSVQQGDGSALSGGSIGPEVVPK